MSRSRTLIAIQEATIRNVRSGREAFASAALGARLSPGKKASVYVGPRGEYSYGIQSQSTGGKKTPEGFRVVGVVTPGREEGPVIQREAKKGRMKAQLARIARSTQLSPEERARYEAAAKQKEGRTALPSGAMDAVRRATYGVESTRRAATAKPSGKSRTLAAMQRAAGATRQVAGAIANRIFGRRERAAQG